MKIKQQIATTMTPVYTDNTLSINQYSNGPMIKGNTFQVIN